MVEYTNIKVWAFEEAYKILQKIGGKTPKKGYVLFETGYGPSGMPHIGTFGEVVRTCYVKFAFEQITNGSIPTKLICFSDDIDGFRKVPENVPHREELKKYLGMPLTSVIDPFEKTTSYGHYMNGKLQEFLNNFGFEYDFISATDFYNKGMMNDVLTSVVQNYEKIMSLMLQNLGEERQATYSPLMPICKKTGKVLAEGVKGVNKQKNTVIYVDEFGEEIETEVINGNCKLQWKIDFGGRWAGLDVDYELFGKDHAPNAKIYQEACKILGGKGPINFVYELFLGEDGSKISKSKGNGITVDEWLFVAPKESLALYMFQKPKTAKRLFFDVIPKTVDEYIKYIKAYTNQTPEERLANPTYFIHFGKVPQFDLGGIDFSLLLHLASAASPENDDILWGFIQKYNNSLKKGEIPFMDSLVQCAINYYNQYVKSKKQFRAATPEESIALTEVKNYLNAITQEETSESIQNKIYSIGMSFNFDLKSWFGAIYEVLLGQKEGPRVGSFIKLYGITNMVQLIEEKLK